MTLIEASIRAGVRPTTMILGEDNRKKWSHLDVLIMFAYEVYKSELCPTHGGPIWLCQNTDPSLIVHLKEKQGCIVAYETNLYQEKHKDDDSSMGVVAEFRSRLDLPLHKYRRRYYDALANESKESEEP